MQTQNIQLSNIVLREQHYLPQKNNLNFNFQLQPITHKGKMTDNKPSQTKFQPSEMKFQTSQTKFQQKDLNARKQMMQKVQKLRKQLLLQKIAAKNNKYELRQKAQKQNKTLAQIKRQQQRINCNNKQKSVQQKQKPFSVQKLSSKQYRVPLNKVEKIYVHNKNQTHFGSTKGFVRHNNQDEIIQKIVYNNNNKGKNINKRSQSNKEVKMVRGNNVKLPELNSSKNNQNQQKNNIGELVMTNDEQDNIQIDASTKEQNKQHEHLINPILKITDVRYFGIQQREEDFQKMGKNLLKTIKRKYWCYDSLENQQIYQNFENMLNQLFL